MANQKYIIRELTKEEETEIIILKSKNLDIIIKLPEEINWEFITRYRIIDYKFLDIKKLKLDSSEWLELIRNQRLVEKFFQKYKYFLDINDLWQYLNQNQYLKKDNINYMKYNYKEKISKIEFENIKSDPLYYKLEYLIKYKKLRKKDIDIIKDKMSHYNWLIFVEIRI